MVCARIISRSAAGSPFLVARYRARDDRVDNRDRVFTRSREISGSSIETSRPRETTSTIPAWTWEFESKLEFAAFGFRLFSLREFNEFPLEFRENISDSIENR